MRKFKMFFILLLWIQICFAEEIPDGYRFQFFGETRAPNENWTDFSGGSCPDGCSQENEVQGVATIKSIDNDYWILSKNKYFYVYSVSENDPLFSTKHKLCNFDNNECSFENDEYGRNKMKDIEFFDNNLMFRAEKE